MTKRLSPSDGAEYEEVRDKFLKERNPSQVYFRQQWWGQYQDGDQIIYVVVREGNSFDEHYMGTSMP